MPQQMSAPIVQKARSTTWGAIRLPNARLGGCAQPVSTNLPFLQICRIVDVNKRKRASWVSTKPNHQHQDKPTVNAGASRSAHLVNGFTKKQLQQQTVNAKNAPRPKENGKTARTNRGANHGACAESANALLLQAAQPATFRAVHAQLARYRTTKATNSRRAANQLLLS